MARVLDFSSRAQNDFVRAQDDFAPSRGLRVVVQKMDTRGEGNSALSQGVYDVARSGRAGRQAMVARRQGLPGAVESRFNRSRWRRIVWWGAEWPVFWVEG
jgi:hypothetical protein